MPVPDHTRYVYTYMYFSFRVLLSICKEFPLDFRVMHNIHYLLCFYYCVVVVFVFVNLFVAV